MKGEDGPQLSRVIAKSAPIPIVEKHSWQEEVFSAQR